MMRCCIFLILWVMIQNGPAFAEDFSKFHPDLSTSDIYLKHLRRIPLSGVWDGTVCFSGSPGERKRFEDNLENSWKKVLVPDALKQENGNPRLPVLAWFRRDFTLPEFTPEERVILTFDDLVGEAIVFINGKEVGRRDWPYKQYTGPQEEFSLDITKFVRKGKNQISIRFYHSGQKLGWMLDRGIYGLVFCDIRPATFCRRILVTPDDDRKGASVLCLLDGSSSAPAKGEIFEWKSGKTVAEFPLPHHSGGPFGPALAGRVRVPSAKEWSCEEPNLYAVRIRNAAGTVMGVQRFGFRTVRVVDGNLHLNGKPVFLRGVLPAGWIAAHSVYAFAANPDRIVRRYFELFKRMNVNQFRPNTMTLTRAQYDCLDELGFLVRDELEYPSVLLKNSTRADHIDSKNYDFACDKSGKLKPSFVRYLTERISQRYSNPCIISFSFGNELRDYSPRLTVMLNEIYDLYRKLDKQKRPCMSSSGRYWHLGSNVKELFDKKEKYDLISTHDYTGGPAPLPFTYVEESGRNFSRVVEEVHGKNRIPVLNGECVYFVDFYYQQRKILNSVWKSADAAEPEWTAYLELMNHWYQPNGNTKLISYMLRSFGAKNLKYDMSAWRSRHVEEILTENRKQWPGLDGFDILMTNFRYDFFPVSNNLYPFDREHFGWSPEYEAMRRACAPIGAFCGIVKGNRFTGKKFRNRITVINNSAWDAGRLAVNVRLLSGDGRVAAQRRLECGPLKSGAGRILPFELILPEKPGKYELSWQISSDCPADCPEYRKPLWLDSEKELFAPMKTAKRVALLDESEKFGALRMNSTASMLKKFALSAEPLPSGSDFGMFDLIVVGADSVGGSRLSDASGALRRYVQNGGRLLVFEQNFSGRIPFLEELEYRTAGPVLFTEITQGKHPLMKNIHPERLFLWNQKDGAVYRHFITPVSRCAVSSGGNTAGWGCDTFGMVHAHLSFGKGDVLLIQSEVSKLFRKDSAAARLARNALEMMTDPASRSFARPFDGLQKRKTSAIPAGKAVPISLARAANASFSDRVAGDRAGAWNDQGPRNDLHRFPVGMQRFGGTPYRIVDPKTNFNRSCVAVSGRDKAWQPVESAPIEVNRKLRRIQFLHAAAWEPKDGVVGEYRIRYEDGREIALPLEMGRNIGGWWGVGLELREAECLWSVQGDISQQGVFGWDWINPRPSVGISSIRIRAAAPVLLGLFGMTGEAYDGK